MASSSDSESDNSSSSSSTSDEGRQESQFQKRVRHWLVARGRQREQHENSSSSDDCSQSSGAVSDVEQHEFFSLAVPLAEADLLAERSMVHVAVRQRNGRKTWTALWGLRPQIFGRRVDFAKILRAMRNMFGTSGTLRQDSARGIVIQLQGDCWKAARHFLIHQGLAEEGGVECHGVLGQGLGGLRDLAQLEAILDRGRQARERTDRNGAGLGRVGTQRPAPQQQQQSAGKFEPREVTLTGFQGLGREAVVQEMVLLEAQLRSRAQGSRGRASDARVGSASAALDASQAEAALEHLEVIDADSETGEVAMLVKEETAYTTILRFFAKGSLQVRGRSVTIRRHGDIYRSMNWEQAHAVLRQVVRARGHRGAESRQLAQRLEELLRVVEANVHGLFTLAEVLTVLNLLICFEFDCPMGMSKPAKWEHWRRLFGLVRRTLDISIADPLITVHDDFEAPGQRQHCEVACFPEKALAVLCSNILKLDDRLQKTLQTEEQEEDLNLHLKEFQDILGLLEGSFQFFQQHRAQCPDAAWRIAARILEAIYRIDDDSCVIAAVGQGPQVIAIGPRIQHLGACICEHGDFAARTMAALQQIYHLALRGHFAEARTLLMLSGATEHAGQLDQGAHVLCNHAVAQLGLCAFRLGKMREAQLCLQDICARGRAKELLGHCQLDKVALEQAVTTKRWLCRWPFHRGVSYELVEVVYLTTEILWEVPLRGLPDVGAQNFASKVWFQRKLGQFEGATYSGPPQNRQECVLVAARHLHHGDWEGCVALLEIALADGWPWSYAAELKRMIRQKVKIAALQTYLISCSPSYTSFELSRLANMFSLEEKIAHSVVSKMMIEEKLAASWDESSRLILVQERNEAPIRDMAYELANVAQAIAERNERSADLAARTRLLHDARGSTSSFAARLNLKRCRSTPTKVADRRSLHASASSQSVARSTSSIPVATCPEKRITGFLLETPVERPRDAPSGASTQAVATSEKCGTGTAHGELLPSSCNKENSAAGNSQRLMDLQRRSAQTMPKHDTAADMPQEGTSGNLEKGGRRARQSRFRKDLINLNKAVPRWLKRVADGEMTHADMVTCISRSPVVRHLREVHGDEYNEEVFVREVLARAMAAGR